MSIIKRLRNRFPVVDVIPCSCKPRVWEAKRDRQVAVAITTLREELARARHPFTEYVCYVYENGEVECEVKEVKCDENEVTTQ